MTDENKDTPRSRVEARIAKGQASTDYRDVVAAGELADLLALIDAAGKPEAPPEPATNLNLSGTGGGPTGDGVKSSGFTQQ